MPAPEIEDYRTVVGLAGDWHGDLRWGEEALRKFARNGIATVYHVGDFGIWPDNSGEKFLVRLNRACDVLGIRLIITPGNHENWARLDRLHTKYGASPAPIKEHIWVLPRGHRWVHAGRSFVSLGGAPSIDYMYRSEGRSWWPEEAITAPVAKAVADAGHADIMITHDAPTPAGPAVEAIRARTGQWPLPAIEYAARGAEILTTAYKGVGPSLLVHGHYHVQDEHTDPGTGRRIVSLSMERRPGNLALLDLENLTLAWLDC